MPSRGGSAHTCSHCGEKLLCGNTSRHKDTVASSWRGLSLNGSRHGGPANWDECSQWQWLTVRNARLGKQRTLADFEQLMAGLNLPCPKFIDHAVPGNRLCGVCPDDLPQQMQAYCQRMSDSPQG